MLAVLIVIAVVIPLSVVAGAVLLHRSAAVPAVTPADWLTSITGERVLVHTADGQTFEGSLYSVLPDGLLLKAPRLHDDQAIDIAGDVFVPRAKVAFVQRHRATGDAG